MVTFPNAKINLGLNVLSRRPDGYHNISSCFYPVDWKDILEIVPFDNFVFDATGIDIPGNPHENLCVRAYELIKADHDIPPVHIHLHKLIPLGAGLGGGSSDGTFTLKMLDDLFELKLGSDRLLKYAAQLGSDCPFFIANAARLVSGVGDQFEELSVNISGLSICIVHPKEHIDTREAYTGIVPQSPDVSIKEILLNTPVSEWRLTLKNDFEDTVMDKLPVLCGIKEVLYEHGAIYASMTGSGSAMYGLFRTDAELSNLETSFGHYHFWKGRL